MKRAVVVGSGAGGATAARELQGAFDVTVLERGGAFRPFAANLRTLSKLRSTGLFFDERAVRFLFPPMEFRRAGDGMVLIDGIGFGGTPTIATGNGVRMDQDLRAIGIDLNEEFEELAHEVPITTEHEHRWHPITKRLFGICAQMRLEPQPTPKMGDYAKCIRCGRCVFGCRQDAKWDARKFLDDAASRGAAVVGGAAVEKIVVRNGSASGVVARKGRIREFVPADVVVLAAGGFGTPAILANSGVACDERLFVDPVLCVGARVPGSRYHNEIEMPFIVQRGGYIISPYIDYLSFFFKKEWRVPLDDVVALMIKLADTERGSVRGRRVEKSLTAADRERLGEGVRLCSEILCRLGAKKEDLFLGTINAGHPGGMLGLTAKEATTLHDARLPENVYVADASLLPHSLGNPPILTIMALAKRVSSICKARFGETSPHSERSDPLLPLNGTLAGC